MTENICLQAPEKYLKRFPVTDALATSSITLGLQFTAERKYFRNKRRMKLKCVASIFDVYLKVNEISVERIRERRFEYSTERLLNLNYSSEYYSWEIIGGRRGQL